MTQPYEILHLQLSSIVNEQVLLTEQTSYYIIIWHGEFALADRYIDVYDGDSSPINQTILEAVAALKLLVSDQRDGELGETGPALEESSISEFINAAPKSLDEKEFFGNKELEMSVVICTRNRAQQLAECLRTILTQRYPPSEIIVVDNCPSDNSTREVVKNFDKVRYVLEPQKGLDIARNTGAKAASYEIVAYTDDDVEVHTSWCLAIWKSFQDPTVGAVTGLIIAAELKTRSQEIFERCWGFNRGYKSKIFDPAFLSSKYPRVWDIGAGANMAFRKSVLEKINYFDERLDVGAAGCNGDSEIWFRILKAGNRIQYYPWAICFHHHRKDMDGLKHQLFYYMRGHVAAALIQSNYENSHRYKKYVFTFLPKYYTKLLIRGFPTYKGRFITIFRELQGILSGVRFFHRHKIRPTSIAAAKDIRSA